ncbi:Mss4-like protein [Coprinopsis sp. MPI-PUGE-AT-0042]|nr:Mss4-like protein [Coprinopsis sp. MPI-PUGE-AT-0042]
MSARDADKTQPYFPLASLASDGWSKDDEATATCFCGAVQLAFPTTGPGLVNTFVCNCADCHKITASMFASNFTIRDSHLTHVRGRENLKQFENNQTIATGKRMTNFFCGTCGTLMYRVGERFPGMSILRIGTVDDFTLHETKLRPQWEQFVKDRVAWFGGVQGEGVKFYETGDLKEEIKAKI